MIQILYGAVPDKYLYLSKKRQIKNKVSKSLKNKAKK